MSQVPIIVLEDKAIRQEDYEQMGLPTSRSNFEFILHPSLLNKTWIRTREIFDNYCQFLSSKEVQGWGKLSGLAIIIVDLGLDQELNGEEIEYLKKLCRYKDQNTPEIGSDQFIGFCAIAKAIENPNWRGVIVVASTRGHYQGQRAMIPQLFACFPVRKNEVLIEIANDAIATPNNATAVINLAIENFMSRFGNVEERLWPNSTENWFNNQEFKREPLTVPVPHNWIDCRTKQEKTNCVNAIKKYLTDLLLFDPPSAWFEEKQFQHLFEDLKHLIGSNSVFQAEGCRRTLTLGNMVLLLAAATAENSQQWITDSRVIWEQKNIGLEILPKKQTKAEARDAVLILAKELFPPLSRNRCKENSPPLVEKVQLLGESGVLKITLDADFSQRTQNDRPSLIEKVQTLPDSDGDVYTGYRKFLLASAKTNRGREAQCVVNLLVENGKTILEFRKCRT